MATSTLYQSSPLGSSAGSPRSCLYLPRQPTFQQPKADWRASFTKPSSRDTYTARPKHNKPLILRQHNGTWTQSTSGVSTPTEDPKPQTQQLRPETPPASPKPPRDSMSSPTSRLRLFRVAKTLRCHVCQSNIREQSFHNHLFFGTARCDLCNLVCSDCRTFERQRHDAERGRSFCQHSFSYIEDPFEYLLPRLSGSDDMEVGGSLVLPNKLRVLQHYVNQLISLQLREPWCNAVRKCKSRLLKASSAPSLGSLQDQRLPEETLQEGKDPLQVENAVQESPAIERETNGWDGSSMVTPGAVATPSPERQDSEEENDDSDEDFGFLLTQDYDLEHLEQAVEYVEVEEPHRSESMHDKPAQHKPKKRRKTRDYRKLKGHRLTAPPRRRRPPVEQAPAEAMDEDESSLVMEEVTLPEDGYYLMVHEVVEECPMCYEALSPNNCTVNLRTFLFAVTCSQCGLLIYIVPELPDGLKIVTETGGGGDGGDGGGGNRRSSSSNNRGDREKIAQAKENNHHKSSRKIRPQDFFAK